MVQPRRKARNQRKAAMERLRQSLLENPRPVFVAYRYIEFEGLLVKFDWLEKIENTEQWAVYKAIG